MDKKTKIEDLLVYPVGFIAKGKNSFWWHWDAQKHYDCSSYTEFLNFVKECYSLGLKDISKSRMKMGTRTLDGTFKRRTTKNAVGTITQDTLYITYKIRVIVISYKAYELGTRQDSFSTRDVSEMLYRTGEMKANEKPGAYAYRKINEMFKKDNNTEKSLYKTLCNSNHIDDYKAIKLCVPRQISFMRVGFTHKIIDGVFKADVSSAFPAQGIKLIPTLKRCKRVAGYAEPNEKYPFAFYINSHHLAIYNELDTRVDSKNYFMSQSLQVHDNNIYDDVPEEKEITILCKAADFTLEDVFKELYNKKNNSSGIEKQTSKLTMNAAIGYFQRNTDPKLSFISAVTIARSNHFILGNAVKLTEENNLVLYIATDSIVWKGKESNVATDNKYLGSFTYEVKNGRFYGVKVGSYQVECGGKVKTLCSYLPNDGKELIKFGELPDPKITLKIRGEEIC